MFGAFRRFANTKSPEESTFILLWPTQMMYEYDPVAMLNDKLLGLLKALPNSGYVFSKLDQIRSDGTPFKNEHANFGMPCAIQLDLPIDTVNKLLAEDPQQLFSHVKCVYPLVMGQNLPIIKVRHLNNKFVGQDNPALQQRSLSALNSYNDLTAI